MSHERATFTTATITTGMHGSSAMGRAGAGAMMRRRIAGGAVLLVATALTARAQCPDGTPPPCRGIIAPAAASARRAYPPLNARAWIVVPFGNVTRSADLEWLRDASVNLLSLDMSRWTDVSVVPDKRVGDLVRELPARGADALTLSDGIGIARRAGAGMLVMGDVFRFGKGARLVANVFDVRSGARVRSVTQQTSEQDSLLSAFAPLARGVLAVPPPPDARTGDVGTKSLDAYQAYLLGVRALNRFDLPEARKQLTRALAIDSTFALAHLQFSLMLEWDMTSGDQAKAHALAARRLGTSLPRRERMLIEGGVASAASDYARLCSIAHSLVAQDSTDIQGVFFLGECSFHDDAVVRSASDTTKGAFRGNWNTAIRSFTRVIDLDPTYLGAFEHIIQMLQRIRRSGTECGPADGAQGNCPQWSSWVLRSGDTLEVVPVHPANTAALAAQQERWRTEKPTLANHALADTIAQRWVDADTSSQGARLGLARAALMRGDLARAAAALRRVAPRAAADNLTALRLMLEVAGKQGRGTEARAIFDSLVKTVPDAPSIAVSRGALDLMFGRMARLEGGVMAAGAPLGPEAVAYQRHVGRAVLGLPREDMPRDEAAFFASMRDSACAADCRMARLVPTLVFSLHVPSGTWLSPGAGAESGDVFAAARALAARDTARLRRAARSLEAQAHASVASAAQETRSIVAADAYLALGDSTSALRMARFFVDTSMAYMSISSALIAGVAPMTAAALWPRMMLMRADLAAAAGQRDEARLWYARVLDLWAQADAELQPAVARIRRSLAALGPPAR